MLIISFVTIIMIALNALYVAAEFSTVSARRSKIRELAQQGNRAAVRLLPIVESPRLLDRYVAACQIGITATSLILGAYAQATLPPYISPVLADLGAFQDAGAQAASATIILLSLTSLQVVFGELIPKSLSLQFPTQTALLSTIPMAISLKAFSWFIVILNGSGVAILRLLGSRDTGHRHIHSPEEIEMLLVESRNGGMLEPDEQERLHRALILGNQPIRRIMVPRRMVEAIDADAPMKDIVAAVLASRYTRFPVYRGSLDNVLGFLHTKDLARHRIASGRYPALDTFIRPVPLVPESIAADSVLSTMREQHSQMVIAINEYGGFEGLVTLEDLLSQVLTNRDEASSLAIERLPDGRVRIPGSLRIEHARPWLGEPENGESNTVGGLVMSTLGRVPLSGDETVIGDSRVIVEDVNETFITSLIIEPRKEVTVQEGGPL